MGGVAVVSSHGSIDFVVSRKSSDTGEEQGYYRQYRRDDSRLDVDGYLDLRRS